MVSRVKYCSFRTDDGVKCNDEHTEDGAYCKPHRRQYQREYKQGLRGSKVLLEVVCTICGKQHPNGEMKQRVGHTLCPICEKVIVHLASAPIPVYDMLIEAAERLTREDVENDPHTHSRDIGTPDLATRLGITDDDEYTKHFLSGANWRVEEPPKQNYQDDWELTPEELALLQAEPTPVPPKAEKTTEAGQQKKDLENGA